MPYATTTDGVKLYFEEAGTGNAMIFVHEFAGDHRSWEPQMRYFSRYFRCISYDARGFTPSDVPEDPAMYSQARARDDIRDMLDFLKIDKAHVVGLSMGGFATLHFGISYSNRARSLLIGGCGYGAEPKEKAKFQAETDAAASMFERETMAVAYKKYASGPTRVQYENKDPRGWQDFATQLAEHSTKGSVNTMRGVQAKRPSLWELVDGMKKITAPALIITGDEDDPCLEPALLMKRNIPTSALVVLPRAGHTINIEEPDAFNRALFEFASAVEMGRWTNRDPRAVVGGILGLK
ncbi:MAG: alpha/beta hydrolase [Betaproteobacteria bacterium]|nr:alpha/beta hydrolase [Betaproteobacteria bacterium]